MSMKDFFDGLDESLAKQAEDDASGRDAATWEPEDSGDTIKGVFLKVDFVADKYNPGQYKPVAIIKDVDTNESMKVWGSRTALRNHLVENHPTPGMAIGIRYNGFTETPAGDYEGYHSYTVVLPERTSEEMKTGWDHWEAARANAKELKTESRAAKAGNRPEEAPF